LPGGGKEGEPNILTRPWQKRRTEDSDYASASEATIDVFSTPLSAPTAVWHHQRIRLPLGLSLLCGSVKTLLHIYSIVQAFKNYHSLLFIAFSIPISNCVKYKKTYPPFEPKSRRDHKTVNNPPHAVLRNRSPPALGAGVEPNAGLTNTSTQLLEKSLAISPRSVRRRDPLPGSPARRQTEAPIKGLTSVREVPSPRPELKPRRPPLLSVLETFFAHNFYSPNHHHLQCEFLKVSENCREPCSLACGRIVNSVFFRTHIGK
jgi:hypothetical protein